ncbi:type I-C CRISPR-associated protein Cas8c/Csd1 [Eilatimonas milleporae]|uniref:CRISPR-associated Csd1 family protein n=1 Tax=Eilatimonas milleporae TaxID=911205 RepID=A0A3M0CMD0_9PROT|nr:type I-C CRISPR-associated protein Cas8c/Csd1 [Eilatimonas milleporae]RMB08096.1 CRISPR-associated Csd1 family protein [Eilatimonas milleporae]
MILTALARHYDRLVADGAPGVPSFGYSTEKIGFCLILRPDGTLAGDPVDLRSEPAKKPRFRPVNVPRPVKRTSGIAPNFLWDKTSYVLGLSARASPRTGEEHAAFKTFHRDEIGETDDAGLTALLHFLDRWTPGDGDAFANRDDVLDANMVFRLDGDACLLHDRPAARDIWTRRLRQTGGASAPCLITGETAPIATLHPAIKNLRGGQSSGGSIVSFNLEAFTSYGKRQGDNAPVSERAAFAYTTALNHLLRQRGRQCFQVGDASTVFWADMPRADEEATLRALMGEASPDTDTARTGGDGDANTPDDADLPKRLEAVLTRIEQGRPLDAAMAGLKLTHPDTRFYILGLAPNAARVSLRFWHVSTLGDLARRFVRHYRDLMIHPEPATAFPAPHRLAWELAAQGKSENIPPLVAGQIMQAILSGGPYPAGLIGAVLMRIRADHKINGLRAGLCKAYLNRESRLSGRGEEIAVALDRENTNAGYRLGRLFAVLESIQQKALPGINATIRDRYYGAASATPAGVFPVLLRGAGHHLSTIRKDKTTTGLAVHFEKEIGDILNGLPPRFPGQLAIEDQGRFVIGYYHEKFRSKPAGADSADKDRGEE